MAAADQRVDELEKALRDVKRALIDLPGAKASAAQRAEKSKLQSEAQTLQREMMLRMSERRTPSERCERS